MNDSQLIILFTAQFVILARGDDQYSLKSILLEGLFIAIDRHAENTFHLVRYTSCYSKNLFTHTHFASQTLQLEKFTLLFVGREGMSCGSCISIVLSSLGINA